MKLLSWVLILAGIFGLIGIRMAEEEIFYDPFLHYFRSAYKQEVFPHFDWVKLILHHIFRFSLNLILALVVVQFMFNKKKWTVQAAVLMLIVFAITLPIYLYCIHTKFDVGYLFSFYMRRFVIQPITLLLIIPLFYYRKKMLRL